MGLFTCCCCHSHSSPFSPSCHITCLTACSSGLPGGKALKKGNKLLLYCHSIRNLVFCMVVCPFYGLRIIWQLQALLRTTCRDRHVPSSRADSDTCTSPTWSSVCLACRSKRCSCNALITSQGIFLTFVQATLFQFQKTVSKPQWLSTCFLTSTLASQHSTEVLASRMFFSKAWWQRFFRKKK